MEYDNANCFIQIYDKDLRLFHEKCTPRHLNNFEGDL